MFSDTKGAVSVTVGASVGPWYAGTGFASRKSAVPETVS